MSANKPKIILYSISAVHDGNPKNYNSAINNSACFKLKGKIERFINSCSLPFSKDQLDWTIKFGKSRYYGIVYLKS